MLGGKKNSKMKMGFPDSSVGKESSCNAGDPSSIPGLGRSPGEGKGYTTHFQYSGLKNSMDCIARGVSKNRTEQLSLSSKMKMPTGLPGEACGWRCRALGGKAGVCAP